jgi:S-adenosylmethionine-dependent methyltransferase
MAGTRPRTSARTAVVWEVLRDALDQLAPGGAPIDIVDAGGGSGGFAVPLAELGHRVVVVDPSPDSLAALERRAAEAGVETRVRAIQGDAAGLLDVVDAGSADFVLCHSVLEVVDDPADALAAVAAVLRPGGLASILVANRVAAVLARVAAGRLGEARRLLDDPAGSSGETDPLVRRFGLDELSAAVVGVGLQPRLAHGVRVFADLVPPALVDGDPDADRELLALEHAAARRPDYLAVATQLHLLAARSDE